MKAEIEYAWAAGILEGEGCFSIHKRKDRPSPTSAIHCEMTDEDVIIRLHSVFGVGTVVTRENTSGRKDKSIRKVSYIWSVQNKKGIAEVLLRVMPYLGERRLAKAKEMFAQIEERGYEV
jgi:hypothetical protein